MLNVDVMHVTTAPYDNVIDMIVCGNSIYPDVVWADGLRHGKDSRVCNSISTRKGSFSGELY